MIEKLLPYWSNRTVRYYYLTEVFINFWVIAPVWFFVFRHFVSVREIGINEIIVFTIGFLAEIPSGALADTFGRKKILVLGGIMLAFGSLATALSNDILPLIAAQSLWFIGYAFYSGANEALAYDELIDAGIEDKWQLISARAKNLVVIVIIASVLLGGVLYSINYRLPFYAHALAMVAFTLCASRYPIEKTKHALGEHSFRAYLKGIKIGTTDLLRPRLRFLVYGVGGFASLYYAYEWGVLRPLILSYRGYEGFSASMLSFVVHCVLFGLYLVLPKLFGKDLTARRILIGTIVASLAFLALMLNTHIWLVGMTVVLFTVLADTIKWWSSVYINQHIASAHRATTLSVWAMLQKIPYIFLVGTITNIGGWGLNVFIMVTGGVVLVAALLALATYHHTDNKITGQL